MSVNKAILIGNLGADPELRQTSSGTSVCALSVATTDRKKNQDGSYEDQTEWHRVNVWSKSAENCAKYLHKGSKVFVEGKIGTRKWDDNEGVTRYSTEITAFNVTFLDPKGQQGSSEPHGGSPSNADIEDIPF